ncbi:xyloside xylosyltransferase 1-like isoform X2 [Artemia franciscana]
MIANLTDLQQMRNKLFTNLVRSILKRTEDVLLRFHVFYDGDISLLKTNSRRLVTLAKIKKLMTVEFDFIDARVKIAELRSTISPLQKYYYDKHSSSRAIKLKHKFRQDILWLHLFFHKLLDTDQVIFMDMDLIFNEDIRELNFEFRHLNNGKIIAMAQEQTPWYQEVFGVKQHTIFNTSLYQGLNTGIILQNLKEMRVHKDYNDVLTEGMAKHLTDTAQMETALGSQDAYVFIQMKYPKMFHILDCSWNYQLATNYYTYSPCKELPKVYHANGNTKFPKSVIANCC